MDLQDTIKEYVMPIKLIATKSLCPDSDILTISWLLVTGHRANIKKPDNGNPL